MLLRALETIPQTSSCPDGNARRLLSHLWPTDGTEVGGTMTVCSIGISAGPLCVCTPSPPTPLSSDLSGSQCRLNSDFPRAAGWRGGGDCPLSCSPPGNPPLSCVGSRPVSTASLVKHRQLCAF
jgi:hypothetical protein